MQVRNVPKKTHENDVKLAMLCVRNFDGGFGCTPGEIK
jgi:hypothetical protein